MKILVDGDTKEILGASSLGTGGDEAIHCVLDAMYAKAPYTVLQRALHMHPTVAQFHCDDPGRSRTFTRANLAAGRRIGSISTEACSIALSWDRLRTRFNARAIGKCSIGGTVASAGMYDYAYPW